MEQDKARIAREFLLVSDFDQTLSFNDSGIVLSDLLGLSGFEERIAGLSRIHMVQQGGELAYLLLHDPEFRRVRREHLVEAGKRIRLKKNIRLLSKLIENLDGDHFSFYVVSAAPEEVIQSALEGIVPADHIFGTEFAFDANAYGFVVYGALAAALFEETGRYLALRFLAKPVPGSGTSQSSGLRLDL